MYKGPEFREHERSVRVARSAAQRYSVFFNGIIAWLFIIFTYLLFMVRASNCVLIKTSIVPSSYPPVAHDQESAYIPKSWYNTYPGWAIFSTFPRSLLSMTCFTVTRSNFTWLLTLKAAFYYRRSRKSAYHLVKIGNRSRKRSHKLDGIGRNQNVSISSDSAYDSVAYDPLKTRFSGSEAKAEE